MVNYLEHHGIEGQKWGVENGPPYPLNKSKYSRSEKKALNKRVKEAKKSRKNANRYKILMNDKELENYENRLKREKNIDVLTKENLSSGSSFIKKNGSKVASAIAVPTLIYAGSLVVNKYIPGSGDFIRKHAFPKK